MPKVELYTLSCAECHKVFRTDDPNQRVCPECLRYRRPCKRPPKKQTKELLTFAQISHIAEVYKKIHHKYLKYGDVVSLVNANAEHCVCCGAVIPEGKQICPQCEKAAN